MFYAESTIAVISQTDRQTETDRQRQRESNLVFYASQYGNIRAERETQREEEEADRQTDRQTGKHTDRHTDRQRHREREKLSWSFTPSQPVRLYQGEEREGEMGREGGWGERESK